MIKFKDFPRPLSVFQVLFKANLIFKDFSRQSCIFKYFSSLCESCNCFAMKWQVSTNIQLDLRIKLGIQIIEIVVLQAKGGHNNSFSEQTITLKL